MPFRAIHVRSQGFAAVNADTRTTHFTALEALVHGYGFDVDLTWNLDDTSVGPGHDVHGSVRAKRLNKQPV